MRLFLAGMVAAVAVVAATATPAHACSCAMPDPRSLLAQTDGAFVGRLIERRDLGDGRAIFTFRVERRVKGAIGSTVDVESASNGAACGLETTDRSTDRPLPRASRRPVDELAVLAGEPGRSPRRSPAAAAAERARSDDAARRRPVRACEAARARRSWTDARLRARSGHDPADLRLSRERDEWPSSSIARRVSPSSSASSPACADPPTAHRPARSAERTPQRSAARAGDGPGSCAPLERLEPAEARLERLTRCSEDHRSGAASQPGAR